MMAPPRKTGPIDLAEAWIIANVTATYRDAAMMFNISHNSIRMRIANDYGSLAEARNQVNPVRDARRVLKPIRRCMRCQRSSNIETGLRMCAPCRKEVGKMHDGGV